MGSALIAMAMPKELLIAVLKRVGVRITAKTAAKFVPLLGSAVAAGISFTAMRMLGNRHVEDCYAVARSLIEKARRDCQQGGRRGRFWNGLPRLHWSTGEWV